MLNFEVFYISFKILNSTFNIRYSARDESRPYSCPIRHSPACLPVHSHGEGGTGESITHPSFPSLSGESITHPSFPGFSGESITHPSFPGFSGESSPCVISNPKSKCSKRV
jgi:hypothetical protein